MNSINVMINIVLHLFNPTAYLGILYQHAVAVYTIKMYIYILLLSTVDNVNVSGKK